MSNEDGKCGEDSTSVIRGCGSGGAADRRPDGEQIIVSRRAETLRRKRFERQRPTRRGDEFYLDSIRRINLYYRSEITGAQACFCPHETAELRRAGPDVFSDRYLLVFFNRDRAGRVTGLAASTPRTVRVVYAHEER